MSWVRLDDLFPEHPKILQLSGGAFRVHVRGICYASRLLTDGFVPRHISREWGQKHVDELVGQGVWEVTDNGNFIHDYLDYNPSREEVESRKESDRNRKGISPESKRNRDGIPGGVGVGDVDVGVSESRSPFVEFWEVYPRREGKRAAERAFLSAAKRASAVEIVAGAERYRDDPNRVGEFTAHASTWLNRDGWTDSPLPARGSNGKPRKDRALEIASGAWREGVTDETVRGGAGGGEASRGLPGA